MAQNSDTRCVCLSGFPEGRITECPVHGNLPSTKAGCDGYLTKCLCEGGGYKSFQRVKGKDVWRCVACGATVKFTPASRLAAVEALVEDLPVQWEAAREWEHSRGSRPAARAYESCAAELRKARAGGEE